MHHPRLEQLRVKQLRFLSLLATHGSLSATAEQLSMTQSAASMMLKEIESLFDVKLFPPIHKNKAPMKKRIETKEKGEMLLTESLMIGNAAARQGSTTMVSPSRKLRI